MKKLLIFLIILGGFFIANSAKAETYTYFLDNFDSYSTGSVYSMASSSWDSYDSSTTWTISNDYASSGTNSLNLGDDYSGIPLYPKVKNFSTTTDIIVEFDFYWAGNATDSHMQLLTNAYGATNGLHIYCDGGITEFCYIYPSNINQVYTNYDYGVIIKNYWYHVIYKVYFSSSSQQVIYSDALVTYTLEATTTQPTQTEIHDLAFATSREDDMYIDNFEYYSTTPYDNVWEKWVIPLDDSGFTSQFPYGCQYNKFATSTGGLTIPFNFSFYNNKDSGITYNEIAIYFYNSSNESTSTIIYEEDIEPNTTIDFNTSITLPARSYRVEFVANGYYIDTGKRAPPIVSGGTADGKYCAFMAIGYLEAPEDSIADWGKLGYLTCQNFMDDCIGTSTSKTDQLLCRLESLFVNLICPSEEIYAKTMGIKEQVQNQFPMSYINYMNNEISDFSSSSQGTTTATNTYSMINFSSFGSLKGNITVLDYIRTIIGYILILITFLFCTSYINKHALK